MRFQTCHDSRQVSTAKGPEAARKRVKRGLIGACFQFQLFVFLCLP